MQPNTQHQGSPSSLSAEADRHLDFYRRGAFVLEAKKVRAGAHTKGFGEATRRPWPAELPEQMRATFEVLSTSPIALSEAQLAEHFKGQGPWKKRLPQILDTLEALGRARKGVGSAEGELAWSRA